MLLPDFKDEKWDYSDEYYTKENPLKISAYTKMVLKVVMPFLAAFSFYFLYSGHFDWFFFDQTLFIVPVIVSLLIPVILVIGAYFWFRSGKRFFIAAFFLAISIFNFFFFIAFWLDKLKKEAFRDHGVIVKAIVIRTRISKGKRMDYDFEVNGKLFSSLNVYNSKRYVEGDSIRVIYNKLNPEMNEPL